MGVDGNDDNQQPNPSCMLHKGFFVVDTDDEEGGLGMTGRE